MGGGACWDADTCAIQQGYLTFPSEKMDAFLGYSCSEINAGKGDSEINMLCAESSVGGVDFTEYNTLVVPYCTQDVFVGTKTIAYDDGSTVNHMGAANTMSVIKWVFENFPNPSHIVLTGCSAGGTALPIAYDLLNSKLPNFLYSFLAVCPVSRLSLSDISPMLSCSYLQKYIVHYNGWTRSPPGMKSVQISTVADSAVYLTPTYFLENALSNWDPQPIMKKINFPYNKYKDDEEYSSLVWNHVLDRGPNSDKWGFITHNNDPISQMYYQYMGGMYAGDDDGGRLLEDAATSWWNSLSASLSYVQSSHKNMDTFIMDGEGHCTFGWYYAMQQSDFDDWVKDIVRERAVLGRTASSAPLFISAVILGSLVTLGAAYGRQRRATGVDEGILLAQEGKKSPKQKLQSYLVAASSFLSRFQEYPVTTGYLTIITFYFWTMLLYAGFAHPVNNPSLGPRADTLSSFGINNPTLIVYSSQLYRLLTAGFLCSGILAYGVVVITLIRQTRYIEKALGSSREFLVMGTVIMLGSNLIYACFAEGATCSPIATVIGLNALSILVRKKASSALENTTVPRPLCWTITVFVVSALFFPFNSWIINLTSAIIGALLGYIVLDLSQTTDSESTEVNHPTYSAKKPALKGILVVYAVMLFLLAFRIVRPNRVYMSPFLTGCDLAYVELPADVAGSFYGEQRRLEENAADDDDGGTLCAEFCVPHIAGRPLIWGADSYSGYSVSQGRCEENGYDTHVADKTFTKATYSVDVEIFTLSDNNDDQA
eukprot:scaffold345_cov134-Cylindrotheca_fusiformis.AAC.17